MSSARSQWLLAVEGLRLRVQTPALLDALEYGPTILDDEVVADLIDPNVHGAPPSGLARRAGITAPSMTGVTTCDLGFELTTEC
ncbi:hypothetical protein [Cellulomonas sp. ICMP 17802]|uniref:hypothetical protein n=1 Tax=Cellulomonas sp. ICMP 17802 TaxID=3239199 RepID=UPI00351BD819